MLSSFKHFSKRALSLHLFFHILTATDVQEIALNDFLNTYPKSSIVKCTDNYTFNLQPFPVYPNPSVTTFPNTGTFSDVFILEIPQGYAHFSQNGYVFLNDFFIKEFQIKGLNFFNQGNSIEISNQNLIVKQGRVTIVNHLYPYCYGHWVFDILSQLALLEIYNIEYDYLCIPYYSKFMQETLEIWGIDTSKIIPIYLNRSIQADTIIIPSPVTQTTPIISNANYNIDFIIKYVREKMLSNIKNIENKSFAEKIFLSRKDAHNKRAIPNEDEIFALFEERGFQRYELSSLSQEEQIVLFHNAKTIVSFVGSGATNLIYCKPGAHYIEIFQHMIDATFFYLSNTFDLQYSYINGSNSDNTHLSHNPWSHPIEMPKNIVLEFLSKNPDL